MKIINVSFLRFGVLVVLAAGVFWTALNIFRADELFRKTRGKLAVIRELRGMQQEQGCIAEALAALAAVSNPAPSLATLASAAAAGPAEEIRELDPRPLERGWSVKRTEVAFKEIKLDVLADFLRAAETSRPPWRLAEAVITASSKTDGRGDAALIMETVAREEP
jgi:hypothetical protein